MKSDDRVTSSRSSSTGYRVKLKASPQSVVCSHMGPATDARGLWFQYRDILPAQIQLYYWGRNKDWRVSAWLE